MSLLQKVLVLGATVAFSTVFSAEPPKWDGELIYDNFDDVYGDAINRTCLGAVKSYSEYPGNFNKGKFGYWYTYSGNGGSVTNPGGEEITSSNTPSAFDVDEQCIHVLFDGDEDDSYAAIASNLFANPTDWVDLSKMTSLSVKLKGSGHIRLTLQSKFFKEGKYDWGELGYPVVLTAEWKTVSIPVDQIEPPEWSPTIDDGVTWNDIKGGIGAFAIELGPDEDGVKSATEVWVDDIIFKGMVYSDVVTPVDPNPVSASYTIYSTNSFLIRSNNILYTITQPTAISFSIFDLRGNLIYYLDGKNSIGTHTIALPPFSSGNYLVKMNGIQSNTENLHIIQ